MSYCINLKQKLNRTLYCKKKNKIIKIKECSCCEFKEYKNVEYKVIKKISSKQVKLEKNRYSIFYEDLSKCYICGSNYQMTKHEIFEGSARRINSMKYGFVLPLCLKCHRKYQENILFNLNWKIKAQKCFENNYGTRDEFIKLFKKNYIK